MNNLSEDIDKQLKKCEQTKTSIKYLEKEIMYIQHKLTMSEMVLNNLNEKLNQNYKDMKKEIVLYLYKIIFVYKLERFDKGIPNDFYLDILDNYVYCPYYTHYPFTESMYFGADREKSEQYVMKNPYFEILDMLADIVESKLNEKITFNIENTASLDDDIVMEMNRK